MPIKLRILLCVLLLQVLGYALLLAYTFADIRAALGSNTNLAVDELLQRNLISGVLIAVAFTAVMALALMVLFRPFTRVLAQIGRSIKVDEEHGRIELNPLRFRARNEFTPIVQALNQVYSQVDAYTRRLAQANADLHAQQREIRELNASLERKVADRTEDLVTLGEIGKELTATLDMEQTFERLYRRLHAQIDARAFLIGLYDAEHACIHVEFCMEDRTRLVGPSFDMSDMQRPAVRCVSERAPLLAHSREELLQLLPDMPRPVFGQPMETVVYLPLLAGDRTIGCLSVQSPMKHAFSESQIEFVRILASYTAIALDNAQSYTRLKQAMARLQHAQEQMVVNEKLAAAGQLTAGVAHEINNPTNFVYGAAQNLEHGLRRFRDFLLQLAGDDAEPEVIAALDQQFHHLHNEIDNILDGSRRIRDIVRDLRAFSRLDEAEEKSVSIADSLRATLSLVSNRHRQHVLIDTDLAADPEILCYPARLNQALMNIIINACQAVEARRRHAGSDFKGQVWITTQIGFGELHISIEDNGCGMDEAVQSRVFEPFFTTRPLGEGIGLGLSVAYGVVKDHGGDIDVESVQGHGSRFTVRLPLRRGKRSVAADLEPTDEAA